MVAKQIFGHTPAQPAGDRYVKFIAVLEDANTGNILVHVRNAAGVINEIALPPEVARELSAALALGLR